jgi:hypothetical protein
MKRIWTALCAGVILGASMPSSGEFATSPEQHKKVILIAEGASPLEVLAAREIRRYLYLTTRQLVPIMEQAHAGIPVEITDAIIVAKKERPVVRTVAGVGAEQSTVGSLGPEEYFLYKTEGSGPRVVLVAGGDALGTLYGAYRLAEHLGVRFYLHGDVVPDTPDVLPPLYETGKPLFELRGTQPFHDFPEGPDWWNLDDYKAILGQLPKLRMNFFGLHTYPEGHPNAEPTVWIGLANDIGNNAQVRFSYPSSYQNTLRGNWGYAAKKTGEFSFGAAELFERDDFGADIMNDMCPQPQTPKAGNEAFRRTGEMLDAAFRHAHMLGIKTCVGTETPLVAPRLVRERLKTMGKQTTDTATIQELYEGIFLRAAQTYPLDYFWLWTPETWTWQTVPTAVVMRTIEDIQAAIAAAKKVKAPFQLATCGWVLGPQDDRALFDRVLPKEISVSCINRQVGKDPVDPGFMRVAGRGKWAIPWLEDDPALTVPQLWAGRMRRDAFDALQYGCNGLMGIHWRTRILAPNISALAWAAWDQRGWSKVAAETWGPIGGQVATFSNIIADSDDPLLYQTQRYNMSGYRLRVPNGTYTVTLKFCECYYAARGRRVFSVSLQGRRVIENLDIFARVGQNRPLDLTFKDVAVTSDLLQIEFQPQMEFPVICAIEIQGRNFGLKVNCGGPAYKGYIADADAKAIDGKIAAFPNNPIADTEDAPLYQTVRYNLSGYHLSLPNGRYSVTLKFCEPHYTEKGKRVFSVELQGKRLIQNLDIFAKVGQNRALDYTFENIAVTSGLLDIRFVPWVEFPSIAAIAIQGKDAGLKINCGGPAYKDYIADMEPTTPRDLPATDFYRDWAQHQFGLEVAEPMAKVFEKLDGKFPCPATWTNGPGGLKPDARAWDTVRKEYDFVDEVAALRPQVKGAGNLERFNYWLNHFRYMRAVAHLNCTWAVYNKVMEKVKAEKDPVEKKRLAKDTALPLRKEMVQWVGDAYKYLLATVSNPGEMGTIANWEQHILPGLLTKPGEELAQVLGEDLPADAQPAKTYRGPTRLIVPTVRTSIVAGEDLTLKVMILAEKTPKEAALYWRAMGTGEFAKVPLVHVARGVHSAKLPVEAAKGTDLEYYVKAVTDKDEAVYFPATAPTQNQTLVVMPHE